MAQTTPNQNIKTPNRTRYLGFQSPRYGNDLLPISEDAVWHRRSNWRVRENVAHLLTSFDYDTIQKFKNKRLNLHPTIQKLTDLELKNLMQHVNDNFGKNRDKFQFYMQYLKMVNENKTANLNDMLNVTILSSTARKDTLRSQHPVLYAGIGQRLDFGTSPLPQKNDQLIPDVPSFNGSSYAFVPVVLLPQGDEHRMRVPASYGPIKSPTTYRNHTPLTASVYKRITERRPNNSLGLVLSARQNFLKHVHEASTMS